MDEWQEMERRRMEVPRPDGYLVYTVDVRLLRRPEGVSGPSLRAEASFVTGEGRQDVAAEADDEPSLMGRMLRLIEDRIAADMSYDSM